MDQKEEFERVFRIYINSKESEAFSLKFYKDTPKEDMNVIIKETISNLIHHFKNNNLKAWQDAQIIDHNSEKNFMRFRESILLSEALPLTSNPFGDSKTYEATRHNTQEDKDMKTDGYLTPDSFRFSHHFRSGQKSEGAENDKQNSPAEKDANNINPHIVLNTDPGHKNSIETKNLGVLSKMETEHIHSQRSSNDPLRSLVTSNRASDREMSITFNPLRHHSFFTEHQSQVSPLIRNSNGSYQRNSNPEDFSLGNSEIKPEEGRGGLSRFSVHENHRTQPSLFEREVNSVPFK